MHIHRFNRQTRPAPSAGQRRGAAPAVGGR
jgi:hypothetical protein